MFCASAYGKVYNSNNGELYFQKISFGLIMMILKFGVTIH